MVAQPYYGRNHLVQAIPDGGNRIQCVQVKGRESLLLIPVYMLCKGITDNSTEFMEVIDQLADILERHSATHKVIISGDLNEDLSSSVSSSRMWNLKEFIGDHNLELQNYETNVC